MDNKSKGSILFNDEGKSFSLLKNPESPILPKTKEWIDYVSSFLTSPNDLEPIGPNDFYKDLDTKSSQEFVFGNGSNNFNERKKKAKQDSKEQHRRSKK